MQAAITLCRRRTTGIFNVAGEKIKDFELNNIETFIQLTVATGVYLVKVSGAKGIFLRRIIIQQKIPI